MCWKSVTGEEGQDRGESVEKEQREGVGEGGKGRKEGEREGERDEGKRTGPEGGEREGGRNE